MAFSAKARTQLRFWLGFCLLVGILGWLGFRMYSRLKVEPYVDFHAFYLAAQAAQTGGNPYRAGTEMYIYPPMLAAWMSPLTLFSENAAAWIWFAISGLATFGSLSLWWHAALGRLNLPRCPEGYLLCLGLTCLIWLTPLRWEFEQGQTDWLMLLALTVAFVFLDRSPLVVGMALGFAINIKYLPLLFVAYLAFRGRWRAVAWSAVGVVCWALAPALIYGWDQNLLLLTQALAGLAKLVGIQIDGQAGYVFPLTYDRSITLPSAVARLGQSLSLSMPQMIAFTALLGGAALAALGAVYRLGGVRLFRRRSVKTDSTQAYRGVVTLEFAGLLVLMLIFSPQAMMRHFYLVLPLVLVMVALALDGATLKIRLQAIAATACSALGCYGADLLTIWGERDLWKFYSGMSIMMLIATLLTLTSGIAHLSAKRKSGPQRAVDPIVPFPPDSVLTELAA